jgi:hypothetical protein
MPSTNIYINFILLWNLDQEFMGKIGLMPTFFLETTILKRLVGARDGSCHSKG